MLRSQHPFQLEIKTRGLLTNTVLQFTEIAGTEIAFYRSQILLWEELVRIQLRFN